MTTDATIGRVSRPRGRIPLEHLEGIEDARKELDEATEQYRWTVLGALSAGGSFSEVSKVTGLSTNTLQRWKREANR